jgi:hypothetical protein
MNQFKEPKYTCAKCNAQVSKSYPKVNQGQSTTKNLLQMSRLSEIIIVECPKCHTKRMLI